VSTIAYSIVPLFCEVQLRFFSAQQLL